MKGYMYILECSDGSYYTGSTNDLERRLAQHQNGEGANHTKKHLPVKLVYFEEFQRIDEAFYREKQVQGWSRKKKEALIKTFTVPFGYAQGTETQASSNGTRTLSNGTRTLSVAEMTADPYEELHKLAECKNESHYKKNVVLATLNDQNTRCLSVAEGTTTRQGGNNE
jgi:predicted GIY-YIG superfamily endonuclease